MIHAIQARRSIRKYRPENVPKEFISEILQAGILAPSSKNRQPWFFTVVEGASKAEMLEVMAQGLREEQETPLLPNSSPYIGGAWNTLEIMRQAPVIIFVQNPLAKELSECLDIDERESEICNAQSIGAAMENMILAATEKGLGTLWICDTCFAQRALREWLGPHGELYAALAIGYAAEAPAQRPRHAISDVVHWRK